MYMFVEERIKDAIDNGDMDDLPGKGEPLDLHDEFQGLAPDVRMGFRMLKQAGYLNDDEAIQDKSNLTANDLVKQATEQPSMTQDRDKQAYEAFIQTRRLHNNHRFKTYAKKIYQKLFPGERFGSS